MKWFKHKTDASDDDFIGEIEDIFGLEGYARWFKILELIGAKMDETDKCSVTYSWVEWQKKLSGKRNKLETFLVHCENKSKMKLERNGNLLTISCPKLLEMRDEYTRKRKKTPDIYPAQDIRDKNTDTEKKVSKKEAQAPLNDKNQMEVSALPDWLPKPEWEGYIEMRKKIRKPMTSRAEDLAIKQLKGFKDQGMNIAEILNNSIMNCWAGLFAPKDDKRPSAPGVGKDETPYHKRLSNYKT